MYSSVNIDYINVAFLKIYGSTTNLKQIVFISISYLKYFDDVKIDPNKWWVENLLARYTDMKNLMKKTTLWEDKPGSTRLKKS